jgi:hypothetical protein
MGHDFYRENLLETTRLIIKANPMASESELKELFWQTIENDKRAYRLLADNWWGPNYRFLKAEMDARKPDDKVAEPPSTEKKQRNRRKAAEKVGLKLLELVMPNNKSLGDNTGAELAIETGWMGIAARIGDPNKIRREVTTEEHLQKLRNEEVAMAAMPDSGTTGEGPHAPPPARPAADQTYGMSS